MNTTSHETIILTPCFKRWHFFQRILLGFFSLGIGGVVLLINFFYHVCGIKEPLAPALLADILIFYCVFVYYQYIYEGTQFEITNEGISHTLHFIGQESQEILFANVKDMKLNIGVLQRRYGLGNVTLYSNASLANEQATGFTLFNIENPQALFDFLKERIRKTQNSHVKNSN